MSAEGVQCLALLRRQRSCPSAFAVSSGAHHSREARRLRASCRSRCNRWRGASAPPGSRSVAAAAASGSRWGVLRPSAASQQPTTGQCQSQRLAGSAASIGRLPSVRVSTARRSLHQRGLTSRSRRRPHTAGHLGRAGRLSSNVRPHDDAPPITRILLHRFGASPLRCRLLSGAGATAHHRLRSYRLGSSDRGHDQQLDAFAHTELLECLVPGT